MKKKWLNGYKVCKRQGNRFSSCFAGQGRMNGFGWKVYGIGTVTKRTPGFILHIVSRLRKYGPLAVFRSRYSAERFIEKNHQDGVGKDWVLFKCRYIESTDENLWYPGYRRRNLMPYRISGTYYADEVELVVEIAI